MITRQEERGFGFFVLGALVGAGLVLLLAEETGPNARHRLSHWLDEHGLDKIRKMLHHNGHGTNGFSGSTRRHKRGYEV